MKKNLNEVIIQSFHQFIEAREFPCIAAKAAVAKMQVKCLVATHLACPGDDERMLEFIYRFVDEFRISPLLYQSAAIIFKQPVEINEDAFDTFFWQRLQSLANMDAQRFRYDERVSPDPANELFSFSLKSEAFFIIGMHPGSSRPARSFDYPVIIFNPHAQFEELRQSDRYEAMKKAVRKRDVLFSGSINPMLKDFGEQSEVFQYSGKKYDASWQCPLKIYHE